MSTHPSTYISSHLLIQPIIHLLIHPSIYLSIHLLIYPSIHPPIHPLIHPLSRRSAHEKSVKKHQEHEKTIAALKEDLEEVKKASEMFEREVMSKEGRAIELQDAQVSTRNHSHIYVHTYVHTRKYFVMQSSILFTFVRLIPLFLSEYLARGSE